MDSLAASGVMDNPALASHCSGTFDRCCRCAIMNPMTIGFGALFVAYGCYTAYARAKAAHQFHKLEAMKKFWGESAGIAIHFVAYTVVPIISGIAMIIAGLNGLSIVDVMKP